MRALDTALRLRSAADLSALVEAAGFLPLLKNTVPGFSVEEHTPPELWFQDGVEGPWEWKGPVLRETGCAYGKFFHGKAGFISAAWFADYACWRRDGDDFRTRYEEGRIPYGDKRVYDVLETRQPLLSRVWRKLAGFRNRSAFDAAVSRLQMGGYVVTVDFIYDLDRNGNPCGWGLAQYATPEARYGAPFLRAVREGDPSAAKEKIDAHLCALLPWGKENQLARLLG